MEGVGPREEKPGTRSSDPAEVKQLSVILKL